jgi:uroporphyrinogen-III synthase
MHVLVTRPEPDALKLKGLIERRGHEASVAPLLSVVYAPPEPAALEGVTGLIATSRNGLRALVGSDALEAARGLTVFAVGGATAEEARRMGFARVVKGPGTAEALGPLVASLVDPAEEVLLHLAGDRLAFDLVGELSLMGINVTAQAVYATRAVRALPADVREAISLGDIDAVLLMSPQTAAVWARLIAAHGLGEETREMSHLCLSEAVAGRLAPLSEVPIEIASAPTLEEMLALVDLAAAKSAI